MNLAFERDYKSYPDYETSAYHERREPYQNPTSPSYLNYVRNMGTMTPARKPQMGIAASHHRRTLSSLSATLTYQQVEPSDDAVPSYQQYSRINQIPNRLSSTSPINHTNRMRSYENVPFGRVHETATGYLNTVASTVNEASSNQYERPDSLPFEMGANSKLRSSLRKYSNPSPRFGSSANVLQQAPQIPHKNSPTKTTPSDSLTSDDSSYLSAKDGSISSQSRVRFSPDILLDQSTSAATATTPLRRLSRSQRHSISDMLAPNASS